MNTSTPEIARHRTAILRRKLSKPVQLLIEDGILTKETPFFDYGCGRGEDIQILNRNGYTAAGWDPHFASRQKRQPASIVNLGYVLNIIEDPQERRDTLQEAAALASDLLVVSVMIRDNAPDQKSGEQSFGDGILTSWSTFQRYFSQSEFRSYLAEELQTEIMLASVGVAYVFKSDAYREQFLRARLTAGVTTGVGAALREAEFRRILGDWVALFHELGRPPGKGEFPEYNFILRSFGSQAAAEQAVRTELDEDTVAERARLRREQAEVQICRLLVRGQGKARFSQLPTENQHDVRIFFGNFENALAAAREKLKGFADLALVSEYIELSSVGKVLPDDIYIHTDSLGRAPEMLQILVELALMIIPDDLTYNIVKIARNSWHVTFLNYPTFHADAHPALDGSMKVLLHKNDLKYRDFSRSENPPILHRKETFLHSEHSRFELYSQLSSAEEEAGLLGQPGIGHRKQWEELLARRSYYIEGHSLQPAAG
ncbi:MAG: DNA phosphorothioation-associated putative methyltransferase [Leptospiraceae bacterium]|nr:DNA phosphorothioation-associated putative methyltransferase [Leptospiraceae bacterium]